MHHLPKFLRSLLPLGLFLCASCGLNTGIYSCISASTDTCYDYGVVGQLSAATKCGLTSGGSLQSTPCPAADRVGRCVLANETLNYYTTTYDGTSAASSCSSAGGTFSSR